MRSRVLAAKCFLVVLVAALVLAASPLASAADEQDAEKAAQSELRDILNIQPRPKTPDEMKAKFKELLPKLDAFVEKHAKTETAGMAMLVHGQILMQLDEPAKAGEKFNAFLEKYPKHPRATDGRVLLGMVKFQSRDYAGAKEILEATLKELPEGGTDPRGQMVQSLLEKVKSIGTPATAFKTKDFDGKDVSLADFKGKVVLLDFFAGWCGPCRAEMPNLVKLYDKYHGRGFEIVGISLDRSLDDAKTYVADEKLKWNVTYEDPGFWQNPVAKLYGIKSIPATYLLDKDGKILHRDLRGKALADALAELFPEEKKPDEEK